MVRNFFRDVAAPQGGKQVGLGNQAQEPPRAIDHHGLAIEPARREGDQRHL